MQMSRMMIAQNCYHIKKELLYSSLLFFSVDFFWASAEIIVHYILTFHAAKWSDNHSIFHCFSQNGRELMELAEQGDNSEVDEFLTDIFGHMQLPPLKIFSFGKLHQEPSSGRH